MGRPGRPRAATLARYIDAMAEPGDFRLSDQQREQATQELREHFAAGRLSDEELSERRGGAILFLTCTVIWVVSGANGQFWPIWVALLAVIPLLRNGWRLYGPDPQFDRVETDLARRARREQRRRDRS